MMYYGMSNSNCFETWDRYKPLIANMNPSGLVHFHVRDKKMFETGFK